MPVVGDVPLSLRISEVLRRQGLGRGAKIRPEIRLLIRELVASLKGHRHGTTVYKVDTGWSLWPLQPEGNLPL